MLFKTDQEVLTYLTGVNSSFKLAHITAQIEDVERDVIKDILGDDEYTSLVENYSADPQELTEEQEALLPYVQRPLIYLAFVEHIPFLNVDVSPGGLRVNVNENRVAASQFRTEDLKAQAAKQGWNAVEALLEFLWAHAEDYGDWDDSDNKTKHLKYFINTSKEFSQYHDIDNSYQVFRKLKSSMFIIEETEIKTVLGTGLFDAIKAEIVENDISAENELLMPMIKLALAKLSVVNAIASLSIDISDVGISEKSVESFSGQINTKTPARDNVVDHFARVNRESGYNALGRLKAFLYENTDTYPLFTADANAYESDADERLVMFEINVDSKIFMM